MSPAQRHMRAVASLGCILCRRLGYGQTPYEDPDEHAGYIGKAVMLTETEERAILALLPAIRGKPMTQDEIIAGRHANLEEKP